MHFTLQSKIEIAEKYMKNMYSGSRGAYFTLLLLPKNFNPVAEFMSLEELSSTQLHRSAHLQNAQQW